RKHEQIQVCEETVEAWIVVHVAGRVHMDEESNTGDDEDHQTGEVIEHEAGRCREGARLNPGEVVLHDRKTFFRHAEHLEKSCQRDCKGARYSRTSNKSDDGARQT